MKTLCIVFGGVSSEHEVSLRSAFSVLENIDRSAYSVVMLGITKDGRWLCYQGEQSRIPTGQWEASGQTIPAVISPDRSHGGLLLLEEDGPQPVKLDVVFGVLHGKNGEDGTIQGLLELAGIPYVGCGVLSSALCMDKGVAHSLLTGAGIKKTGLMVVYQGEMADFAGLERRLAAELGYPMFVKPANAGSSVGVSRAENSAELAEALALAFEHDKKVVVEQEVIGREIECSAIGNETPIIAQMTGEIVPTAGFYDYEAKYLDDSAKLYIPAEIDEAAAARMREIAAKAYKVMCCEGFARVDFFLKADGEVLLNEINTIPGFTSISMFPKLFEASGMAYSRLISALLEYALERSSDS
ncbi:MAG: D-alanine--D-alanine ligase [Oscillospiraceae bacterium]|nr:D-alanine--D-alanine ligase [Oscillospiraceae bacterium]